MDVAAQHEAVGAPAILRPGQRDRQVGDDLRAVAPGGPLHGGETITDHRDERERPRAVGGAGSRKSNPSGPPRTSSVPPRCAAPEARAPTHSRPPARASPVGRFPTAIRFTTRLVSGSMRSTTPPNCSLTHTPRRSTAIAFGPFPTA